jgi:hypothetical protein
MTEVNNPSKSGPIKGSGWYDRSLEKLDSKRCTGHKKNGEQCRKFAIYGTNVCRVHGGAAPQVKRAARIRLEMAADRMARHLLGLAEDAASEAVQLAATNSALDRSGIQAKTAVSVEVSTKPFELVFDAISAGPRHEHPPALAIADSASETRDEVADSDDDEILGEIDDDQLDADLPRLQSPRESESDQFVDVGIVDAGYTDEIKNPDPESLTSEHPDSSASGLLSPTLGPLGLSGPVGSGLMTLTDANEAVAEMRAHAAARIRDMRRQ